MGSNTFLCVCRVGNPSFPPSPIPETSKIGGGVLVQQESSNPAPGRTARGKKLFGYFSTFLTYLVKIVDELIRIMTNSDALKPSAATAKHIEAELLCKP